MSIRNLDKLLRPQSIAVIGASGKPRSVGLSVMNNLLAGGFAGPVFAVNPTVAEVNGVPTYSDVESLPLTPDVAVVATPPDVVPSIVTALGRRGTRAAVILTAGFTGAEVTFAKERTRRLLASAQPHLLRILGPNCFGLTVPAIGLNTTFAPASVLPGNIAFLTQSGAMASSVMDWALARGIGFSAIVSMGDMSDVDFGDLLDYFALDETTHAILLYAEGITHARKFMSAARRAGRVKPVIVIKGGRVAAGARAAASHTGALAGADVVYDAAFRRAGMLRVYDVEELFDAVTTLARMAGQRGDRLAIVSNGGGIAVLATDRLIQEGGRLASLAPQTIDQLNSVLPSIWSHANPIDLVGDADVARYASAIDIVMKDPNVDALLVAYCPTMVVSSEEAAQGVLSALALANSVSRKNVFACWVGAASVAKGRACLSGGQVPDYETPERAVRAFMHLVRHRQSREILIETPSLVVSEVKAEHERPRRIIQNALKDRREWLDQAEVASFLDCYGIPFVRTEAVPDAASAAQAAARVAGRVALKIRSRDIVHKSDIGGVVLDIADPSEVAAAARQMKESVARTMPKAKLEGFIVQEMAHRPGAFELIAGVHTDPTFGPVILFGHGGTAVEVLHDQSIELPPLNSALARAQINRTRISELLKGFRGRPQANVDALVKVLLQLSRIVEGHAGITEIDINPLLCDSRGVMAVDGRIRLRATAVLAESRLAIRPYPRQFESKIVTPEGVAYSVRPIRPEDELELRRFASEVGAENLWHSFFAPLIARTHQAAARLSQIDYDREMTMVAWKDKRMVGVARSTVDPNFENSECAIVIRDDVRKADLAVQLLQALLHAIATQGVRNAVMIFPTDQTDMLSLCRAIGFTITTSPQELPTIRAAKVLQP